jgi:ornithine cyclodeaminase
LLTPIDAVNAVRAALAAHRDGRLSAPPRVHVDLGDGALVFTAGRLAGDGYGFRVYDTLTSVDSDQLTAVFDDHSGRLRGVVGGDWLGAARTGAIGAVAVDTLSDPAATRLGIVGTGRQAWSQLWAIRAVRVLTEVRVYSRDAARREDFARRCETELGLPAAPATSARAAVEEAEIVVLATNSGTPVIEGGWVPRGAHVTTLGPKEVGRYECPIELADRADRLVTDSPAQLDGYAKPFILTGTRHRERIEALSSIVPSGQSTNDLTLFYSVGLAGTEVAVAAALLSTR